MCGPATARPRPAEVAGPQAAPVSRASSSGVTSAVSVAKVFGPGTPESFRQGEAASQMTPASPFGPGSPIGPYDGYDRMPRAHDYQTGYNIATRPRTHERVSFETLKGLLQAYDVADICIWHRIDSIRSLKWKLLAADHYFGDVTDAVPLGLAALKKPDRKSFFKTWLAKYAYDILAYDAGTLYRMRNRAGRAVGLKVVSGPTIAPLLDYWGDSPEPPAEAYVQYAQGLPMGWLTRDDIIYEPFRPNSDSPYGRAPIESILLNANTDLRFQVYFMQTFTEGNLPAAFAAAPESWSPDQIEQFQTRWDAMMYGDQAGKHQIKWMPPGSKFEWSNEKEFSDGFPLYLMRKTCAAFHVVPSDLGFTENVNRSSGESQADVQHRVGDLPFMEHIEGILSAFLLDDLGLPLKFEFDRGEEQVDQLAQAEADQKYMDRAVVSSSEIREMRYGLTDSVPVPRVFFSERAGPIPLNSLLGVAGPVDPQTAAPEPGAELPRTAFTVVEGVVTSPPLIGEPLAEQEYGPKALPPGSMPVAKEGEAAPGITSDTGIYGDPLIRDDDDQRPSSMLQPVTFDDSIEEEPHTDAVKSELAVFRRFERARRKSGEWRDFRFTTIDPVQAHNLNDGGRLAVRKAAGEVAVAGLAVLAADTGRVLMLQRSMDPDDQAAGTWEFPGGHLDNGESPLQGAWREWAEESGCIPPPGAQTGTWTSGSGIYQGIVWTVDSEASVPVRCDTFIANPDDPDGDQPEAIAWWDPATLPGNPAIRSELLADIDVVMTALGCTPDPDCCGAGCCSGGCCDGTGGCQCGPPGIDEGGPEAPPELAVAVEKRRAELAEIERLMKTPPGPGRSQRAMHRTGGDDHLEMGGTRAGDGRGPKVREVRKAGRHWPGWDLDLEAVGHWAPLLAAALAGALSKAQAERIAAAYITRHPASEQGDQGKREAVEAAAAWLAGQGVDLVPSIAPLVPGILSDAHLIGGASAAAMTDGGSVDLGGWQPGDTDTAQRRTEELGIGAGLSAALASSDETAQQMAGGYLTKLGRALVDGAASGLGAAAIGASLVSVLADPENSSGSVLGQLVIGIGAAALALYLLRQVQMVRWVTDPASNVCPACLANEAASPYRVSGAPDLPAHPRCRCTLVPA